MNLGITLTFFPKTPLGKRGEGEGGNAVRNVYTVRQYVPGFKGREKPVLPCPPQKS